VITDVAALLAPYRLAEPGSEPAGLDGGSAVLAPDDLDDLPAGVALGEVAIGDAPQGCRSIAGRIADGWSWRLTSGEGVALRQGKGAPRGSGTRPKLAILDPCASVALRAAGPDVGFPDVTHHVIIVWVRIERTGRWAADGAWAWSTESAPDGLGRTWQRPPRRWKAITEVAGLLYAEPSADAVEDLFAAGDAERDADAMTLPEIKR
jgi:hypothetical protein